MVGLGVCPLRILALEAYSSQRNCHHMALQTNMARSTSTAIRFSQKIGHPFAPEFLR